MGNHGRFSTQKRAKDGKKYVDYRKKFKYSVSDGNPLSYYNGTDYTFTWEQGRQLASVTKGNKTASYTYDMSGVRSSKTVNGVSYEYTTLSGKITRMTWSGNAVDIVYDDAGRPYILRYTPSGGATQTYYYALNLQGDVVGLMNTSMQMVVKYSYDPWGKLTGTTATSAYVALAQANPLRYRSYCYDIETGFYYLQTRYYDPTIARFINADGYLSTDSLGLLSYNMFAYCENNPIMCSDPTGSFITWDDVEYAWNWVSGHVSEALDTVSEAAEEAYNDVKNYCVEAWNGITDFTSNVGKCITNFVDRIPDYAYDLFHDGIECDSDLGMFGFTAIMFANTAKDAASTIASVKATIALTVATPSAPVAAAGAVATLRGIAMGATSFVGNFNTIYEGFKKYKENGKITIRYAFPDDPYEFVTWYFMGGIEIS